MCEEFKITEINHRGSAAAQTGDFGLAMAEKVNAFHKSFPGYAPTPLCRLDSLSASLGLKGFYVKDESRRFDLNAFKVLGGSFAIGCHIAEKLGLDISELPFEKMVSSEIKEKLGEITFVTATDGNHGRGVAWTANRLGQKSVVFMPKGTAPERLENIKKLNSDASITDLSYDDDVRLARECAEKYGWITVQDTSWPGYENIPKKIMQGYTTMALEAYNQLNGVKPTHIFLQAGVGSMAGAVCGFITDVYGEENRPVITVVEPNAADCLFRTAQANDGKLHFVSGDMHSMMAGLCCGEPCGIAWEILREYADFCISMPEYAAPVGMRTLGRPLPGDPAVISGESGASTAGLVIELMQNEDLRPLREKLGLTADSVVLCFSTEGDTDRENYNRILSE